MATPTPSEIESRLAELERLVRELRGRIAQLESRLQPRSENPIDRQVTQEKVRYDWQS